MATDFLNDARREIEGRTEDFYGELKAFYQGNAKAEQNLMEQTTQPFWQSLCLSGKRLQQRDLTVDMEMQEPVRPADYDGPKKDGYDYTCHRTKAVEMRRTYYRKGKKIATLKTPEIVEANFLKAEEVEDRYRLSVEVKMRLTQDTGSKIRNRYEKLRLELEGRQEIVTQHGKALREYKCPNCGGSVDILGGGVCDYCNAAVDYRNFGWIITSYTNLGQPENPYAKILVAALGIYGIILAFSLVLMICSEDGKETLEIWQSIGRSSEYLEAVKQDIVYPDDVLEGLTETDSEEGRLASVKTYACGDSEAVKEAYHEALLESGFIELQQYPEGFAVYKIEDPSEYTVDEEEEMFYLVICAENAPEGITVTATLVDENWDPVQE